MFFSDIFFFFLSLIVIHFLIAICSCHFLLSCWFNHKCKDIFKKTQCIYFYIASRIRFTETFSLFPVQKGSLVTPIKALWQC